MARKSNVIYKHVTFIENLRNESLIIIFFEICSFIFERNYHLPKSDSASESNEVQEDFR